MKKGLVAVWRDTLRDSGLSRTPKLVGFVLSTFMDGQGVAWPSKERLAAGASLGAGKRSVDRAVDALEAEGFLAIERSRGRSSHRYQAELPPTAQMVRRSEWATAQKLKRNRASNDTNSARRAPESIESVESPRTARLRGGGGALIEDDCMACWERRTLYEYRRRVLCLGCILTETGRLEGELRQHVTALRVGRAAA